MKSYDTESRNEENAAETQAEQPVNEQEIQSLEAASAALDVAEQDEYEIVEDEQGEQEKQAPSRFRPPSREQWRNWLPFWGLILLGGFLRFWELGMRPLHHDESLHGYFALQLLHNNIQNWASCLSGNPNCYTYDPLLHGPFQFHAIAFVYLISQWLGAPDHGVNTFTVRIAAATLGTLMIGLPYFMRDYLGKLGAWLAAFLLAVAPSMVYFSRFAREDIYMAFFTLLLVVATGRYIRERKMRWLVIGASAFALSYATSEATFLTIAVFGSFLGALAFWEVGKRWPLRDNVRDDVAIKQYVPEHGGLVLVALYFIIFLPIAKIGLNILNALSTYVINPKNTPTANLFVQNLKSDTVALVPWIGILLGLYVLSILVREIFGKVPEPGRRGLAKRVDPQRQPFLDTIVTMPWTHWFFAVLSGWTIFLILFTALFTNIRGGIGDGIWQGLYYWLQQQQVARGGQPWYYYLLLIPLYEQIGVVFGIVGIIRCLLRPNPFRLFLVYWFIGNFAIYSWAGEKMPWLMIFMVMPMCLLAAIGLEPWVMILWNWFKGWQESRQSATTATSVADEAPVPVQAMQTTRSKVGMRAVGGAAFGIVCAILLLIPTLHNMYEVNFVDPADGPHEMMIYVQTTPDVNIVMNRINQLDQKIDKGQHQIAIGVMSDAAWPFAWYLRDYTDVCYGYPTACPSMKNPPVIITGGDNLYTAESQNGKLYLYQQYRMRTWWDEGYKPPPCVPTKANKECAGQPTYGGVGLGLWLSYGDNPPAGAHFNLGLAAKNIWDWWWYRKAIGSTGGDYPMGLFIQKGLGVTP